MVWNLFIEAGVQSTTDVNNGEWVKGNSIDHWYGKHQRRISNRTLPFK